MRKTWACRSDNLCKKDKTTIAKVCLTDLYLTPSFKRGGARTMTVLWNTNRAGFTMTGLELKGGSLFIGLSRSGAKVAAKNPPMGSWRRKEGSWIKSGFSGSGNAWFFGVARAEAGKTMTPSNESPFEAYRRARLSSPQS